MDAGGMEEWTAAAEAVDGKTVRSGSGRKQDKKEGRQRRVCVCM